MGIIKIERFQLDFTRVDTSELAAQGNLAEIHERAVSQQHQCQYNKPHDGVDPGQGLGPVGSPGHNAPDVACRK